MSSSAFIVIALLGAVALAAIAYALGRRATASTRVVDPQLVAVHDSLDRLTRRIEESESLRREDQAGLRAQIGESLRYVGGTAEALRKETASLAAALGRVDVRGRWGEAQLRRLVEAAGMIDHVHFVEQDVRVHEDGYARPDMVIDLGGGRSLVVDAKVPLNALLAAEATDDPRVRSELLTQHAKDVAAHADRLGSKAYWRHYDDSVELVVMFLPAESILGIACRETPALLEQAFARNVAVATPTSMLALLRTVSHVWRREAMATNAREIRDAGQELLGRLEVFLEHVRKMGSSLDSSVAHYNKMVGSLDSRVLVSARRLASLGVGDVEALEVKELS